MSNSDFAEIINIKKRSAEVSVNYTSYFLRTSVKMVIAELFNGASKKVRLKEDTVHCIDFQISMFFKV